MAKQLSDQERAIVQMAILDRWNRHRLTKKICDHFGLSVNKVRHLRSTKRFQDEYRKQLAIYQQEFGDICLGDRKERVKAMNDLYQLIPDYRVALKLKVLAQIRVEVGQDQPTEHPPEPIGTNLPPRAQSYEEWLKQNQQAEKARQAG